MSRRRTIAASAPEIWRGWVEDTPRLAATVLLRAARRRHPELWWRWADSGEAVLMPVLVPLSRGGIAAGEVNVMVALHGQRAAAEFPSGAAAALVIRPTNIRGLRWWWLCPRTGSLCASLFLPPSADAFGSRQAYGLHYRAESEQPTERAARKARKLRRRLGEAPAVVGGPLPDRPLRMRWETYERLCAEIREAEGRALPASARLLARVAATP